MNRNTRRDVLVQGLRGALVGLLGLLPGSIFAPRSANAVPKESLEDVLKRVTKEDLYQQLNTAELTDAEKLAIATVKEVEKSKVEEVIKIIRSEELAMGSGNVCGSGCGGSCGNTCGNSCAPPKGALSVVDKDGKLKIKLARIDKTRFVAAVEKALKFAK